VKLPKVRSIQSYQTRKLTFPTEFNEHQRDVFCVFSGVGVQRLRNYLNTDTAHSRRTLFEDEGTMYDDEAEPPELMDNVTAQANGMGIEDMDDDFGDDSELQVDN
jgi:F-box and leucine-rich repeat protein GRR1